MFVKTIVTVAALVALAAPFAAADEINPVVGKVGDFTMRETDLERIIATQPPQVQKQLQEKPELKTQLVRDILLKRAIAVKARKDGLDRKPELREQLAYLIDDFLAREYLTKIVLADLKVSDDEVKKYYQEHQKDFQLTETVRARHIFFPAGSKAADGEKAKARAKAEVALARLKKGEDFIKLATELSEDADTAKKGGDLGTITPGKTNSEEFEKAVFSLKSGEISGVVETPFGFHIIKADEKIDNRLATFDESRAYIEALLKRELEQKKGEEFIVRLLKESGLEVAGEKPPTPAEPAQSPASK
jgi:peptidyl-prolyl cis-trans isomerase C